MFDPYHKWLGISPKDQPPNHYRLLAVDLFEADPDVIDTAANRQMAYLQQMAAGEYMALSQRLLNEIAAARLCLLNPQKKHAYDDELKAKSGTSSNALNPTSAVPHDPVPSPKVDEPASVPITRPKLTSGSPAKPPQGSLLGKSRQRNVLVASGITVVLVLVGIFLWGTGQRRTVSTQAPVLDKEDVPSPIASQVTTGRDSRVVAQGPAKSEVTATSKVDTPDDRSAVEPSPHAVAGSKDDEVASRKTTPPAEVVTTQPIGDSPKPLSETSKQAAAPPRLPKDAILILTFDGKADEPRRPGVSLVPGKVGKGLKIVPGKYLELPERLPVGRQARTVALWFKAIQPHGFVFSYGKGGAKWACGAFGIISGEEYAFWYGNHHLPSGEKVDSNWHHHCVVYDGNDIQYFFDGRRVATRKAPLDTEAGPLIIGGDLSRKGTITGVVDEFVVFNRDLSGQEVQDLYEMGQQGISLRVR